MTTRLIEGLDRFAQLQVGPSQHLVEVVEPASRPGGPLQRLAQLAERGTGSVLLEGGPHSFPVGRALERDERFGTTKREPANPLVVLQAPGRAVLVEADREARRRPHVGGVVPGRVLSGCACPPARSVRSITL